LYSCRNDHFINVLCFNYPCNDHVIDSCSDHGMYESEIQQLTEGIAKLKKDCFTDNRVIEILETWREMLYRFPEEVSSFDSPGLHDYMVNKTGYFRNYRRDRSNIHGFNSGNTIDIVVDGQYFYHMSSVLLVTDSSTFLYPYKLIHASNTRGTVSRVVNSLDSTGKDLALFLKEIACCYCDPGKITAGDIAMLKLLVADTGAYERYKSPGNETPELVKSLQDRDIISLYYRVNYPVLALVPLITLSENGSLHGLPPHLDRYIDNTIRCENELLLRTLLVPSAKIGEVQGELQQQGVRVSGIATTCRATVNLTGLKSAGGYPSWEKMAGENSTYELMDGSKMDILEKGSLAEETVTILAYAHYHGNIPDYSQLAPGSSWDKEFESFTWLRENDLLRPYLVIKHAGLVMYHAVVTHGNKIMEELDNYTRFLPRTWLLGGEKLTRLLLFLPENQAARKMAELRELEKQGVLEILLAEKYAHRQGNTVRAFSLGEFLEYRYFIPEYRKRFSIFHD